ncbi:uncharacterized protein LOC116132780 [Pistacia vera]|uniref:uncharacterized protein LOC116132780 n=1 Tax=Pistacia vera TaxID=55513 RepID=UPI001262D03E|nr:uncharacterized protein LOC116132780 [Pistacia vera]
MSTTFLKDTDESKDDWTVTVRLSRLSECRNFRMGDELMSLDMIFIDEQKKILNQVPIEKEMFENRTSLQHVTNLVWHDVDEVMEYTIKAKIIEADDRYGWCYNSCTYCKKKIPDINTYLYCEKCNKESKSPQMRYKVEMRVSDGTAEATFILFDTASNGEHGSQSSMSDVSEYEILTPKIKDVSGKTVERVEPDDAENRIDNSCIDMLDRLKETERGNEKKESDDENFKSNSRSYKSNPRKTLRSR